MERQQGRSQTRNGPNWQFFRAGGFDQVRLEDGAALMALDRLDQKLWAALSCPTDGIEFDPRTLSLIDTDGDGRIRAAEVIAAIRWAGERLKDPDILLQRTDRLPLSAIDDSKPEGRDLLAAARHILASRDKAEADSISADEVADTEKVFADTLFNGDGVVPAEAAQDTFLSGVIGDIIDCLGGVPDRSGRPGVTHDMVDQFFERASALAAWARRVDDLPDLAPAGTDTAAAFEALAAVEAKIDDYFIRCRLAAFDSRSAAPLNRSEADWETLAAGLLTVDDERLRAFPLAFAGAARPLPLTEGVNPSWSAAIERFRTAVVLPVLGPRDVLPEEEWRSLRHGFSGYRDWRRDSPPSLGTLGRDRLEAILTSSARSAIGELIDRDLALEGEAAAIASVDRLVRYLRDLATLADNFVAFRDFYTRRQKSVFQAGTLFIDGRSCDLCVRIDDVARHAVLAQQSRIYLLYCECRRPGSDGRIFIAAAVTAGDSDQLAVGRNGLFYDRQGRDWDATVVRIIDHPISIRQAFWAPYKKLGRLAGQQLEKFATARSATTEAQTQSLLGAPAKVPPPAATPAASPAQPFDAGRFAGIFAAAGLALGAIGTAVASVVTGVLGLPWWQIPLALAGVLLAISGPSMAVASFKLHQRTIGPILDANGWAVNTRARITIPFGSALTELARLPEGSSRALTDPYAEKRRPWGIYGIVAGCLMAVLLLWWFRHQIPWIGG
ncbi:MAG: hypothetical protein F8N37_08580 [Telmatospirillum sp.]|nr:hypothetical protein [Telmatospirillum sp.]